MIEKKTNLIFHMPKFCCGFTLYGCITSQYVGTKLSPDNKGPFMVVIKLFIFHLSNDVVFTDYSCWFFPAGLCKQLTRKTVCFEHFGQVKALVKIYFYYPVPPGRFHHGLTASFDLALLSSVCSMKIC